MVQLFLNASSSLLNSFNLVVNDLNDALKGKLSFNRLFTFYCLGSNHLPTYYL